MKAKMGKTALISGASRGMGEEFARQLAQQGWRVVLAARSEQRLSEVVCSLPERVGLPLPHLVLPADLTLASERSLLQERLQENGIRIDLLINNAGSGDLGLFVDQPAEKLQQTVQLNIEAATDLTRALLPSMIERGKGRILITAGTGACIPVPGFVVYAAAESYLWSFGLALREEVSPMGVRVSVLSPGITKSSFFTEDELHRLPWIVRQTMMEPKEVVTAAIQGLRRNQAEIVPGLLNKLNVCTGRHLPISLRSKIAGWMLGHQPRK